MNMTIMQMVAIVSSESADCMHDGKSINKNPLTQSRHRPGPRPRPATRRFPVVLLHVPGCLESRAFSFRVWGCGPWVYCCFGLTYDMGKLNFTSLRFAIFHSDEYMQTPYTHIYMHIHMYTYIHTHTYIHTYVHIKRLIYISLHTHTYIHTYLHAYMHICVYTHNYILIYIYIHTHTWRVVDTIGFLHSIPLHSLHNILFHWIRICTSDTRTRTHTHTDTHTHAHTQRDAPTH